MAKLRNVFSVALILVITLLANACDTQSTKTANGCGYDIGSSRDIDSVRVFYPCEMEDGRLYDVVTLSGGMTNVKEDMYWLAEYLVDNDIIVFALTASDNMSVSGYEKAHKAALELINTANTNSYSPMYRKFDQIGIIGFSMGGGGVLNVGADYGASIDAIVALAPYSPQLDLSRINAPTCILVGANDGIAPAAQHAIPAYARLPWSIPSALGIISDFSHLDFMNDATDKQVTPKMVTLAWLQYAFEEDADAMHLLYNPPSEVYLTVRNL